MNRTKAICGAPQLGDDQAGRQEQRQQHQRHEQHGDERHAADQPRYSRCRAPAAPAEASAGQAPAAVPAESRRRARLPPGSGSAAVRSTARSRHRAGRGRRPRISTPPRRDRRARPARDGAPAARRPQLASSSATKIATHDRRPPLLGIGIAAEDQMKRYQSPMNAQQAPPAAAQARSSVGADRGAQHRPIDQARQDSAAATPPATTSVSARVQRRVEEVGAEPAEPREARPPLTAPPARRERL